jgi:ATP-dependent Zn protease
MAARERSQVEVQQMIEILCQPRKFQKLDGRIPKGVLMMVRPGRERQPP